MKNLLVIFITIIILTNVSYNAFLVLSKNIIDIDDIIPDTNEIVKKDTKEDIL